MGRVISCAGKYAEKPFCPDYTGRKLYSAEELGYYISQNLYLLEPAFFNEELCSWLSEECGLAEAAGRIKELRAGGRTGELAAVLLCATDYFTEAEVYKLLRSLEEFQKLPAWKRKKILADSYIKNGQYREARLEYEKLLQSKDAASLSAQEHGEILHGIGIVLVHLASYLEAAESFLAAYRQCRSADYLKHSLYACKLGGYMAEYRRISAEEKVPPELERELTKELIAAQEEAEEAQEYRRLQIIFAQKEQGHVSEYYQGISELLEEWKAEYRSSVV